MKLINTKGKKVGRVYVNAGDGKKYEKLFPDWEVVELSQAQLELLAYRDEQGKMKEYSGGEEDERDTVL